MTARVVKRSRAMEALGAVRHTVVIFAVAIASPVSAQDDAGSELEEPSSSPSSSESSSVYPVLRGGDLDAPSAEAPVAEAPVARPRAPETPAPLPRNWRYPRELIRRPLTMPQGVGRFDSIVALTMQPAGGSSGNAHMSGFVALAGGIFDDLEIGAVPLAWTFFFPQAPDDPHAYLRVRVLSGEVQLAFRGGVWVPVTARPGAAQIQIAAELAWLATPFFRLDVSLDYQLLFTTPLQQRVGLPVTGTFQIGIHAISLTSAVFVFNDFDDVDVPLLVGYSVSFRGYRQPMGEWAFEGGFLDLERAEDAWTMRSRFTFFV